MGDAGGGFGDGFAVAEESFNMELDTFADELFGGIIRWPRDTETGPQRLKPQSKCSNYGTAEAVPLSKAAFSQSVNPCP